MMQLVLGGARSGKSSFAEQVVLEHAKQPVTLPVYVATAQPLNGEMQQRILHHQQTRDSSSWQLVECPLHLSDLLLSFSNEQHVLIDCMTLWLNNQLTAALASVNCADELLDTLSTEQSANIDRVLHQQVDKLITAFEQVTANITLVSNEIGLGVVPLGQATRIFVDHQGWLNQKLARIADRVTLVTAGIPLTIKGAQHG